jgi:hypothetical protein
MNTKRDTTSATNSTSTRFRHRIGRAPLALLALVALALTVSVREANGQGTIYFNNRISGAAVNQTGHIWGPSTNNPDLALIGSGSNDNPSGTTPFGSASGMALIGAGGSGGQYGYTTTFAQLIGAVGQNMPESALVPLAGVTTFRTGSSLGGVAAITSTFTNNPASVDAAWATVEIVAWDNSSGRYPTWTQASAAWNNNYIAAGHSAPFNVANIGGTTNAAPFLTSAGQPINGLSFNLSVLAPKAVTLSATGVTPFTARLNGVFNSYGWSGAFAFFEWGNGNTTDRHGLARTNMDIPVSEIVGQLTPGTTYNFRACAYYDWTGGVTYGSDQSFTTLVTPIATLPATAITATSATLNGTANPSGWFASAWFQWGATTNYGNLTAVTDLGYGTNALPLLATVDGLTSGTTYHFRAVANFGPTAGTNYGSDLSFETAVGTLVINTGSGYWDAASSTLSYAGDAAGAQSFILLESADPTAPLNAWTRVATNNSTPGSFPIPPVGTAAPKYYRVKSE